MSLKVLSLNCNGLREEKKRNQVFQRCKLSGGDIVFLQETHIVNREDRQNWNREWGGKGIWSHGSDHGRGVGILLHPKLDCEIVRFAHDWEGRSVVVDVDIDSYQFRLVNVYCPNVEKEREEFIEDLESVVNTPRKVILGGDFNFVEDTKLDKIGGNPKRGERGRKEMDRLREDFDLVEIYRCLFPDKKEYTYHDHDLHCRLDRFYIGDELVNMVQNVSIVPSSFSDHDFVEMTFKGFDSNSMKYGPGRWKCNVKVLLNADFKQAIEELWFERLAKVEIKDDVWWEGCKASFKELIVDHSKRIQGNVRKELAELEKRLSLLRAWQRNEVIEGRMEKAIEDTKQQIRICCLVSSMAFSILPSITSFLCHALSNDKRFSSSASSFLTFP